MRIAWIGLAALIALAGSATAQVAAPALNPLQAGASPVPRNPAVLAWDGPSRIGGGIGPAELDIPAAPTHPVAKGQMRYLQAQWVGDYVAAGATASKEYNDVDPTLASDTKTQQTRESASLAAQLGGVAAVGIGQFNLRDRTLVLTESQDYRLALAGAALRLVDVVYLGAASGSETVRRRMQDEALKRNVSRWGLGIHWRDATRGVHLEAYRDRAAFNVAPIAGWQVLERRTDGGTAEFVLASVLLGYERFRERLIDPNPTGSKTYRSAVASLGWVPASGLSIVASQRKRTQTDASGVVTTTETFSTLGVAMLY